MKQQYGFTLIELLITLALLGIILGLAMPAVTDFAIKQRVSSQANEMMLSLAFARSEAVKRNLNVRLMPVTGTHNGWEDGWCIGIDDNSHNEFMSNCGDPDAIRVYSANSGVTVVSAGISAPPIIKFRRDGAFDDAAVSISVSAPNLKADGLGARCIKLNRQGRAEVEKVARDDGC